MKFPRPRTLQQNEFPDNISTQPVLFQNLVQNIIHPPENSAMDSYINASIEYLKAQHRLKAKSACLNVTNLESTLYFVDVSFPPSTFKIKCLVDTGASHTIIHHNIISRLNIAYKPLRIKLKTATGVSDTAVKGVTHTVFKTAYEAFTTIRRPFQQNKA